MRTYVWATPPTLPAPRHFEGRARGSRTAPRPPPCRRGRECRSSRCVRLRRRPASASRRRRRVRRRHAAYRARPRSDSGTSGWLAEPRHTWPCGRRSAYGSGMIASSSASVAACLRVSVASGIAAVAQEVEVELRRLPPCAQSREQRAQTVGLFEGLAAADGHAVERVAGHAPAPRDEVRAPRSPSSGPAATCPATRSPAQWIVHPCSHRPIRRPGPSTVTGQCALLSCKCRGLRHRQRP